MTGDALGPRLKSLRRMPGLPDSTPLLPATHVRIPGFCFAAADWIDDGPRCNNDANGMRQGPERCRRSSPRRRCLTKATLQRPSLSLLAAPGLRHRWWVARQGLRGTYLDENAMLARAAEPAARGDAGAASLANRIAADVKALVGGEAAYGGNNLSAAEAALSVATAAAETLGARHVASVLPTDGDDNGAGGWVALAWRAPRGGGGEAILLVTDQADGGDEAATALALAASVGAHVGAQPWLAKDLYWVAADGQRALAGALAALVGEGPAHGGTLAASAVCGAIALRIDSNQPAASWRVMYEGYEGAMPNLDLPTLALHMAKRSGLRRLLAPPLAALRDLPKREATVLSTLLRAAGGRPTGAHAELRRYDVDAITIVIAGGESTLEAAAAGAPQAAGAGVFAPHVAALELTLRSLNSLLERFHHSHIQYALVDEAHFADAGVLVAPLFLLLAMLLVVAARLLQCLGEEAPSEQTVAHWVPVLMLGAAVYALAPAALAASTGLLAALEPSARHSALALLSAGSFGGALLVARGLCFVLLPWRCGGGEERGAWMQLKTLNVAYCGAVLAAVGVYNLALATAVGIFAVPMVTLAAPARGSGGAAMLGCGASLLLSPLSAALALALALGADPADVLAAWLAPGGALGEGYAAPWVLFGACLPMHAMCMFVAAA